MSTTSSKTRRPRSSHHRSPVTESAEDYLERIYELAEETGEARVSDLAQALKLSRPSVSIMVRRLVRSKYIRHEPYGALSLTKRGSEIALMIKQRHHLLTEFFTLLELTPETVAHDVEGVEHHVSPEFLERLQQIVQFWRKNPEQIRRLLREK